jgi:thiopeptide-type bacteriocin biosynthesis protein
MATGLAWRLQLDTYEREMERYGGEEGMQLSERLFHADSDAALAIVERLEGDDGSDARWRLAVRGMDQLLDDLGFALAQKHALLAELRLRFGREFRVDTAFERQLGERFRKERLALEALLDREKDSASPLEPGLAALAIRSEQLRSLALALRVLPQVSLPELAGSYLHMHCNRMLRGSARAHELVLYDYLERLYRGQLARRKSSREKSETASPSGVNPVRCPATSGSSARPDSSPPATSRPSPTPATH